MYYQCFYLFSLVFKKDNASAKLSPGTQTTIYEKYK